MRQQRYLAENVDTKTATLQQEPYHQLVEQNNYSIKSLNVDHHDHINHHRLKTPTPMAVKFIKQTEHLKVMELDEP